MISSSAAIPNRRDWTRNNMIMVGIMTNAKRSASPTLVPDRASHKRRIAIDPSVEAIITAPSQGSCCRIRSEEHTSELQSLMRISYAVFCLKKKNKTQHYEKCKVTIIKIIQDKHHTTKI